MAEPTQIEVLYSQRHLDNAVNLTKPVIPFLMDSVFRRKVLVSSDVIDYEQIEGLSDIAGFINDDATEPVVVGKGSKKLIQLKVPRIWEEKEFTVQELKDINNYAAITNRGERAKAIAQYINDEVLNLKQRIIRFHEYFAAKLLQTGKLDYTRSKGGVNVKVDFGFVTSGNKRNLEVLADDDRWNTATDPDLIRQFTGWKRVVKGANLVIMGSEAADYFRDNEKVLKYLDNNNIQIGKIDLSKPSDEVTMPIADNFLGMKVVEYHGEYWDGSQVVNYMDPKKIIVLNTNKPFTYFYAPVTRIGQNNLEVHNKEYYVKPDVNAKRTKLSWEIENKPLLGIKDKTGILCVTTHA